jgi:uncharacterized protein (DUF952 family)
MLIYHVVIPEEWEAAEKESFFEAKSLSDEGFTHCSYADQLEGVLERYFADAGEVVILHLDANRLTSPLVSEPSTNDEPYPHIYGPINKDAIVTVEKRVIGENGAGDLS